MNTTNPAANLRSIVDDSRSSQKSGSVKAPERRRGAATNSSNARYPAAKPTGYQSMATPFFRISPATPRNDAADRYSPLIAAAFHRGLTAREATRKSEVVRASRSPYAPMATVASVTAMMAGSAYGLYSVTAAPPLERARRRSPFRPFHEVGELGLGPFGLVHVHGAEREQERVGGDAEQDPRQAHAEWPGAGHRGRDREQHRQTAETDRGHQRQPHARRQLCPGQPPQERR